MNIYDIEKEIEECVDLETGEVKADRLEQLLMERDKKIEGAALIAKSADADIAAIDKEIERLQERKKVKENTKNSCKEFLKNVLAGQKFETAKVVVSFRNVPIVVYDNEDKFLEHILENKNKKLWKGFLNTKTITKNSINKKAVEAYVKEGNTLDGCHYEKRLHAQIK